MSLVVAENVKRISITSKRQMTIPLAFFSKLGFGNEAECMIKGDTLIVKPIKAEQNSNFAEQILADLIKKGYSGQKLLEEFKKVQSQIRPAVEKMLDEAHDAANGKKKFYSTKDVFDDEND